MEFLLLFLIYMSSKGDGAAFDSLKSPVGSTIVLPCTPLTVRDEDVLWSYHNTTVGNIDDVAQFGQIINGRASRFSLVNKHDLKINYTLADDAGLYSCIEDNGAGERHLLLLSITDRGFFKPTQYEDKSSKYSTTMAVNDFPSVPPSNIDILSSAGVAPYAVTIGLAVSLAVVIAVLVIIIVCVSNRWKMSRRPLPEGATLINNIITNISRSQSPPAIDDGLFDITDDHAVLPSRAVDSNTQAIPTEMIEIIIMKAAIFLRDRMRLIPQLPAIADYRTIKTILKVCAEWKNIAASRRWNRRQLRRLFCRCPQLLAVMNTIGPVSGVTVIDDKIYVLCQSSNEISVFNNSLPFDPATSITLPDLEWGRDMASCEDTRQLFIADFKKVIWRVNVEPCDKIIKLASTKYSPLSLSAYRHKLIVTPLDEHKIYLYHVDGELLQTIMMSSVNPYHAVETYSGTFIVSYMQGNQSGIAEIDNEGRLLKAYGGPQLDVSQHLAVCNDGSALAAVRQRDHVVLLHSSLQSFNLLFKRADQIDEPSRLYYAQSKKQLVVGLQTGVRIYSYVRSF